MLYAGALVRVPGDWWWWAIAPDARQRLTVLSKWCILTRIQLIVLLNAIKKRSVVRDYGGILRIQLMLMELQVVSCFQDCPSTKKKISDRVEPEKAVPGLGIGNLSESQTLHRVKDPAIHDEAMRS